MIQTNVGGGDTLNRPRAFVSGHLAFSFSEVARKVARFLVALIGNENQQGRRHSNGVNAGGWLTQLPAQVRRLAELRCAWGGLCIERLRTRYASTQLPKHKKPEWAFDVVSLSAVD